MSALYTTLTYLIEKIAPTSQLQQHVETRKVFCPSVILDDHGVQELQHVDVLHRRVDADLFVEHFSVVRGGVRCDCDDFACCYSLRFEVDGFVDPVDVRTRC